MKEMEMWKFIRKTKAGISIQDGSLESTEMEFSLMFFGPFEHLDRWIPPLASRSPAETLLLICQVAASQLNHIPRSHRID
jgi:hypothetical protein